MKREHLAAGITVLLIVGVTAALALRGPRGGPADAADKPSSVVFGLYQRAGEGDIEGYLACLTPQLRRTLESSRREMGEAAFRESLVRLGRPVKGVSVTEERVAGTEARLRVELVYADRTHNDVQTFTVARWEGRWLIASMSGARPLKMPIPYGTPAYPLEQEAQGSSPEAGPPTAEALKEGG
ncbi:MAG: hypothetical protein FJX74_17880 [Armatimonadetes bacterium]|nr:hypothetical protein [Armatimonadota bacterium]